MFSAIYGERPVFADLSPELRDVHDWKVGSLRALDYHLDSASIAYNSLSGLLAVGTGAGTICIYGGAGVELQLRLPEPLRVKFIQFALSTIKLVCVDERDQLHVWDLATPGHPRLVKSASFGQSINAITLSPSHTHAFVALHSGEIKTYDLICLKKSPYALPNLWSLREQERALGGEDSFVSTPGPQVLVEVTAHPRDLNLMLVAYGGGIILADLAQQNITRAYELIIPAGAPGGGGYSCRDLLTHRRPLVTTLAVHPAGHYFAAGYSDGCIAFWAIEDDDQPLLVRTITDMDVNVVDGTMLERFLPSDSKSDKVPDSPNREPIYRLAWCGFPNSADPRGGETALVILGGSRVGEDPGVNVELLPAFALSETPSSTDTQSSLHPSVRKAMRSSVTSSNTALYAATEVVRDFLLIPRHNPHFSGSWDPLALLLIMEGPGDTRAIEVRQFPPPALASLMPRAEEPGSEVRSKNPREVVDISPDLTTILEDLKLDSDPAIGEVPSGLWSGTAGVIHAQAVTIPRNSYESLVEGPAQREFGLPLRAGSAWVDDTMRSDAKLAKYQPRRILITSHRDLTVRFQDISPHLLISSSSSPLQCHFPRPLPALTLNVGELLTNPVFNDTPSRCSTNPEIQSVHLATESLECVVTLKTGELLLYRLDAGPQGESHGDALGKGITLLHNIRNQNGYRYHPYILLTQGKASLTSCAISDVGFLAVAYSDASLLVVDLRGPSVLQPEHDGKETKRHSLSLHLSRHHNIDTFSSLTWAVSGIGSDPRLGVRLIATRASGPTKVYKMTRVPGSSSWNIDKDSVSTETLADTLPSGSFVIDSHSGDSLVANKTRFAASLQPTSSQTGHCIWVTASTRGARCVVDITGERIGKADWSSRKYTVERAQIIEKNGSHALVAFTDKDEALVYSLPHLEHLHTLVLPPISDVPISVDETGDFIGLKRHFASGIVNQITLATLFNTRRVYDLPQVDLAGTCLGIPPHPQPVSVGPASVLGSWIRFGKSTMTGEQLDAILAGPDRPIQEQASKAPLPTKDVKKATTGGLMETVESTQNSLYERLTSALSERGQALGDLNERLDSLEQGSKDMVAQAKRLAAEQGAKRWFEF
ncbi:hypothetical protein BV22DRAFT_999529 [Leucogyrophana mollusca]|uniref:Uncharacterized protein n=1 Tax=Leucogyrophana mollusca TaxID=85980 RepID=A0ACB8BZ19_9AGAM|nr:hypothetical protein BV22DRAFT_999529 [Leucogyrophana mollusca]